MDADTKQVLLAFGEILEAQLVYTLQVHKSTTALARSVLDEPTLNGRYGKHWESILQESPEPISPEALRSLERLRELVRRLKA